MITTEKRSLFKVTISNIMWDCYAEDVITSKLPIDLKAFVFAYDRDSLFDEELSDFLSDEYGFCVFSYDVDSVEEVEVDDDDDSCSEVVEDNLWNKEDVYRKYEKYDDENEDDYYI